MLTEGPVGEWATLPGTHTALMYDVIRFAPDGTGETRSDSTLGGETVEHFTWSVARPGLLTCVMTDATWMPEPGLDDHPDPDETQKVGFQFEELMGPAFSGQLLNGLAYAASCRFRYSLWTSCGVL